MHKAGAFNIPIIFWMLKGLHIWFAMGRDHCSKTRYFMAIGCPSGSNKLMTFVRCCGLPSCPGRWCPCVYWPAPQTGRPSPSPETPAGPPAQTPPPSAAHYMAEDTRHTHVSTWSLGMIEDSKWTLA